MARPFTASDEDILLAAAKVISRRGPDAFSLAEVATEVGLSRAAIILRFKSTQALKVTLLTRMVESFAGHMAALPKSPGGDSLLRVAAFIGSYTRSRESSAKFFANYFSSSMPDRELLELEHRRGEVLHRAIAEAMPPVSVSREAAVNAFRNHLTGNIMAWLSLDDADGRSYMVRRTTEWLQLVGIAFSQDVVKELLATRPELDCPAATESAATTPAAGRRGARRGRSKPTRIAKRGMKRAAKRAATHD